MSDDVRLFIHAANLAAKRMIYRFPTEAEWEYACRAGTTTAWSFGNDESQLANYAWYIENATNINEDYAHQVGLKKPNPWGLYDMHGNVAEWVLDGYDPYPSEPQTDPKHGLGSPLHVIRSGYFGSFDKFTRSAYRFPGIPNSEAGYRGPDTGFRLVRVAE